MMRTDGIINEILKGGASGHLPRGMQMVIILGPDREVRVSDGEPIRLSDNGRGLEVARLDGSTTLIPVRLVSGVYYEAPNGEQFSHVW